MMHVTAERIKRFQHKEATDTPFFLLLHGVGDEKVHILSLVQQHHGAKVAHSLVREPGRSYQLQALHLDKGGSHVVVM